MAKEAFAVSSHYDSAIFNYFDAGEGSAFVALLIARSNFVTVKTHIRKVISTEIWKQCSTDHGKEISLTIFSTSTQPLI
jgi:hypothetical protein